MEHDRPAREQEQRLGRSAAHPFSLPRRDYHRVDAHRAPPNKKKGRGNRPPALKTSVDENEINE
jgi:hypothetical protein